MYQIIVPVKVLSCIQQKIVLANLNSLEAYFFETESQKETIKTRQSRTQSVRRATRTFIFGASHATNKSQSPQGDHI